MGFSLRMHSDKVAAENKQLRMTAEKKQNFQIKVFNIFNTH